MSTATALDPVVTIATAYIVAVGEAATGRAQAQQPRVILAATQTVTPDPAPSH